MNINFVLIIIVLCEVVSGCKSNQNSRFNNKDDNSIHIKINVSDTTGKNRKIRVVVFSELPIPFYANQGNYKKYTVDLKNSTTLLKFDCQTDIAYIQFFDCSKEINGKPFMIESGEICQLNVVGNTYSLAFSNSKLFELQERIFSIPIDIFQGHDYTTPDYNSFFIKYRDSLMVVINAVARDYKSDIPANLLNLIRLNMISKIGLGYTNTIANIPSILPKEKYNSYINCLDSLIAEYKDLNDFDIKNSYNYAEYGTKLLRTRCLFDMENSGENAFECAYNTILSMYSGLLRDKLLCIFLNRSRSQSRNWSIFAKKAINVMHDTTYKQSLSSLITSSKVGSRAYEFNLLGDNGKYYTLSSFKGKVIVCHLWFTGCHGCSTLSKVFKSFEQKYRGRKDVQFININVDSDTARWKRGLASGLYTGKSEINLNIGRKGWSDDMLKYYGYFGYPQILLIDKNGNIISSSPEYSSFTMEGLKVVDSLIYSNIKKEDNNVSS